MKSKIKVHARNLNEDFLTQDLEKKISRRNYDTREVEKVNSLDFAPTRNDITGFDPSKTTELFENSVATPDFNSQKYRFLPGLVRKLAYRIFPLFSLLYEKLSEHKIQAFYHVVHELIALNYRFNHLKEKFNVVLEDYLKLRELMLKSAGKGENDSRYLVSLLPQQNESMVNLDRNLVYELGSEKDRKILVIDDRWGHTGRVFVDNGFLYAKSSVQDTHQYIALVNSGHLNVIHAAGDTALALQNDNSLDVLVWADVANTGSRPEVIAHLANSKLKKDGIFIIRYVSGIKDSPFTLNNKYILDVEEYKKSLLNDSLLVYKQNSPDELRDGSFELFCKVKK